MHDPLQAYQALGACSLGAGGYGLPYAAAQTPGFYGGIPQIPGIHPFAGIQSPMQQSPFQNPLLQNPLLAQLQNPLAQWQHPLLAQLQNPLLAQLQHPLLAQLQNPLAQLQHPLLHAFQQQQQPYGYPLQPQTLTGGGQQGIGQGFGQIHPLALQLALRQMSTPGISPWAGF